MNPEPTSSQRSVLQFVEERIANGEGSPTYREICDRFGFRSPKAAADHIAALEKKGLLVREKGSARGLRLVRKNVGIPLFGRIPAGPPQDTSSDIERYLPIDAKSFGVRDRRKAFAVQVSGDSMIGRNIFDGDIVILEYGHEPHNGDIVAALIDNESTLKTLVRRGGKTWLRAENPLYPNLVPAADLKIQGTARAVIRLLNI